ncbi:MAG: TRAM domain-containing protein, partial [Candidatus Aenigmarchaeota archaeon]|nr:TRAM domain-containing protein [Candidatus Aenigmarchaeota archaeon]MDW8149711.1 TRAM domain-containing protein [Candidatus Aenigmarchaeota archaeon]
RKTEAPVKVGEEYDIEVTEMGAMGDGVTRIKNFVVFIKGGKVGEKYKVKIEAVKRKFAVATIL